MTDWLIDSPPGDALRIPEPDTPTTAARASNAKGGTAMRSGRPTPLRGRAQKAGRPCEAAVQRRCVAVLKRRDGHAKRDSQEAGRPCEEGAPARAGPDSPRPPP